MTYNVLMGTLNPTHSLTHSMTYVTQRQCQSAEDINVTLTSSGRTVNPADCDADCETVSVFKN